MIERVRHLIENTDDRLQLHGLRRAFASRLAATCTVPVASALLGHNLEGVVGRYVHADKKALADAMDALWRDFAD